ncbi:DUF4249 domain-containing protein [Spirosoma sp. BT702]|uniref:DUF4249 domain-containing protein n=1 Tax=Spirosoma profusum TaxID=2771354 RepID=A0A926XZ55_9BACT|nr:DUF4249 domain-containing protein [Spirosoma profusum]MBD2703614.1 DUF4249 domain-containing protein [Spirosoma profusum]
MQLFVQNRRAIATLLAFLAGFIGLNSCSSLRNEVSPSLLGATSTKLVVTCYLSPQDTILAVKVTRSNTVVGDSISLLQTGNNVTDATVTLSDGSRTVVLTYNRIVAGDTVKSRPYYSADIRSLPIVVDGTYTLHVTTPNGQIATSRCTIPAAVPLKEVKLDSINQRYYLQANWQDPANQVNYYQVSGSLRYILTSCVSCKTESASGLSFEDDNRGLFSDSGVDGTVIPSGRAYLNINPSVKFHNQFRKARVILNLLSVDQSYFLFQDAINRQRRSRNNPFAEPVLIPSNIDGGLGCFAGYNTTSKTLTIK